MLNIIWLPYAAGEYVNFVTISVWDQMFTVILATVVFLATIKMIKMLRFNKRMGMLGEEGECHNYWRLSKF